MTTYGKLFAVLTTIVLISARIGCASNLTVNTTQLEKFEGRLQTANSYWYNDVYYWWPWFSDLATVIMIKLKIAIGLAAIYAFGDGYYWSKGKETVAQKIPHFIEEKYNWGCSDPKPWYKFWGRRKRDLSGTDEHIEHDQSYAEFVFDLLDVENVDCRRLAVCEMEFDAASGVTLNSELKFKHDLFRKYRGTVPKRKSDCRRIYKNCATQFYAEESDAVADDIPKDPKR
ncbi:uncharacterized protein LOC110676624 [Aedes aegypti]|uniref:Uncharacterized protein n=1 Tax=Aedes aegypti TaxID=7159 RepID=A0A6I8UA63_AEDAE|nr:uncharacterized protein LOC110676624 [Aedes aegypti]